MDKPRIRIVGDHPWSGYTGVALAISRPTQRASVVMEPMVRVQLDRGQECPDDHECYVGRGELEILEN